MIDLQSVSKTYRMGDTDVHALVNIDLHIARNDYVAIIGSSGSGKSTMMNVLGCLDSPTSGSYTLDGEEVARLSEDQLARVRNRKIGFIFQSYYLMPRASITDNVAQPLIYRGISPAVRQARAAAALARVGLGDRIQHKPNELSGGQRQRVAIARALVGKPEVLLADEPTGNLDSKTAREIMELFSKLHQDGMTIIIVTHDPAIAAYCRRVISLRDGLIVEDRIQPGIATWPTHADGATVAETVSHESN
jgi:putative ABC transport system ATP-binding protein